MKPEATPTIAHMSEFDKFRARIECMGKSDKVERIQEIKNNALNFGRCIEKNCNSNASKRYTLTTIEAIARDAINSILNE